MDELEENQRGCFVEQRHVEAMVSLNYFRISDRGKSLGEGEEVLLVSLRPTTMFLSLKVNVF